MLSCNHTILKAKEGTTVAMLSHKAFFFAVLAEGRKLHNTEDISSVLLKINVNKETML